MAEHEDRAAQCRQRARHCQQLARQVTDPEIALQLRDIAATYERLARQILKLGRLPKPE